MQSKLIWLKRATLLLALPFCDTLAVNLHELDCSNLIDREFVHSQADSGVAQLDQAQKQKWSILRSDLSLRRVMLSWVQSANWRLQWEANTDMPIVEDFSFEGDFATVVHNAMTIFADAHLFALIDNEHRVLRITAVGPE